MLERLLIVGVVLLIAGAGCLLWRLWQRFRLETLQREELPSPLAQQVRSGQPAVLYFTSEGCLQCKVQQAPILAQFAQHTGVPVHELDAVARPDLADFFGVMTVPTTVVLDRQRRPVAINYGLAPLQKLRQQVEQQRRAAA